MQFNKKQATKRLVKTKKIKKRSFLLLAVLFFCTLAPKITTLQN
jgi:hypothetical protein